MLMHKYGCVSVGSFPFGLCKSKGTQKIPLDKIAFISAKHEQIV